MEATDPRTIDELKLIVGEAPDMQAKVMAELAMDEDGLSVVLHAFRDVQAGRPIAGHVRGILEPMAARFAAYVQVARMMDEGLR
jgi:hypothetical protein